MSNVAGKYEIIYRCWSSESAFIMGKERVLIDHTLVNRLDQSIIRVFVKIH
jgi:hypothetical protein